MRNTDYGVTMGVGLEVDAGPGRWVLEGRYEPGLADLGTAGGTEQMHSRAFVLSTGYRF